MKIKTASKIGITLGVILGSAIIVYAVTNLIASKSVSSNFTKKQIFEMDLTADLADAILGPGDTTNVTPVVENIATEPMYVFVEVQMPTVDETPLYTYEIQDGWVEVSNTEGNFVYAYGNIEMTKLLPGESTDALMEQITMAPITNAEFYEVDDINITINGFAVEPTGLSTDPKEAWSAFQSFI